MQRLPVGWPCSGCRWAGLAAAAGGLALQRLPERNAAFAALELLLGRE
ncbi:MAG: hypothetical protein NTY17_02010 [Planctomycetia bacterium]|nr:hypothetical protein [Planctomycetia bacterium]